MVHVLLLLLLVLCDRVSSLVIHPYATHRSLRFERALNIRTASGTPTLDSADLTPAVDKFPRTPLKEVEQKLRLPLGIKPSGPDPFKMVSVELQPLSEYIKSLLVSENPVLTMAATHFFDKQQGKQFRPTIISLLARALEPTRVDFTQSTLYSKVLQLGQITEMIHVASLIHDDVLDGASTRRGGSTVHAEYSNKVAVLAGDHLLARASVLLARLRHFQVVEVMAGALDALVQGEIMQLRSKPEELLDINHYLRKSYFKTASLICSSCKSVAMLCGHAESDVITVAAERYGYHLGMAYQIVDDILDYTGASATLGKPAQADMGLGLATAPMLYASQQVPELNKYILRRFKTKGDIQKAVQLAKDTDCVQQSYELAEFHAQCAEEALQAIAPGEFRNALVSILQVAISRDK